MLTRPIRSGSWEVEQPEVTVSVILLRSRLTDFQTPVEVPKLHIIKYASDGTTVINETYVDYTYMENNLPVIGDGTTVYKFEGLTLNPSNLWDPEETYPGGYKISNVVKGITRS